MSEVHRNYNLEREIEKLESFLFGKETGGVELLCPKGICSPIIYSFPVDSGQTEAEALQEEDLPECEHGVRVVSK